MPPDVGVKARARRAALRMGLGLAALACMVNPWRPEAAEVPSERQKIDALIGRVAARTDLTFERNGVTYSAGEAARHLRMKREFAGGNITTARQFIDRVGTASSITGIAYHVRLPDGTWIDSADFLRAELASIEAAAARPGRAP